MRACTGLKRPSDFVLCVREGHPDVVAAEMVAALAYENDGDSMRVAVPKIRRSLEGLSRAETCGRPKDVPLSQRYYGTLSDCARRGSWAVRLTEPSLVLARFKERGSTDGGGGLGARLYLMQDAKKRRKRLHRACNDSLVPVVGK